ncbi:MAG: sigma D regulator [Oceanospirillaceae bacterium]|nr:sigma D regulator [Oceanospirillaceae bacterium]|tara:strand:+ start:23349 stop:23828 length:480 start_codon:yes stop_codon:yes gene_type:complete
MLETCKSAQERWGGVHKLIDRWLNSRQGLIVQFCALSSGKPLSLDAPLGDTLSRFCETLMDYCSHGHFEIYDQLLAEAREYQDEEGIELANTLVPKLDELTSRCVDFNDTYDEHCTFDQLARLPADLSGIGELLEERFELEDQLIEKLHNIHQQPAVAV